MNGLKSKIVIASLASLATTTASAELLKNKEFTFDKEMSDFTEVSKNSGALSEYGSVKSFGPMTNCTKKWRPLPPGCSNK